MVDVVLVLLIIFMATAPLIHRRAVNVNVPATSQNSPKATKAITVFFSGDNRILVDKNEVKAEALAPEFKRLLLLDPTMAVMVAAEAGLPYGEVVELLDNVRAAGVKKVALEVRAKKK